MGDEEEEENDYEEGLGLSADIPFKEFIKGFMQVDPEEDEEPTENGEDDSG